MRSRSYCVLVACLALVSAMAMGSTVPTSHVVPKASAAGNNVDYDPAELQGDTRIFKMPIVDSDAEVAQQVEVKPVDTEAQPRILTAPDNVQKLDELAGYNGPVPSKGVLFVRDSPGHPL